MSTDPGSTTPTPNPTPPVASVPPVATKPTWYKSLFTGRTANDEIIVYQHTTLFYWWPVWLLGFICCLVTFLDNKHLAIVPAGTIAAQGRLVELNNETTEKRDVLILDAKKSLMTRNDADGNEAVVQPTIYVSQYKTIGSLFTAVLLIVIVITNVTVRGLWSVVVLLVLVMTTIIFAVAGWWETIFQRIALLSIHINLGGYLLISTVLFVIWLINLFVFDRQTYVIFTPGQVRIRTEIGGGETVFDTTGMTIQKQRSDLFRHWILGFGSGDLLIQPFNQAHPILMHNVLHVGLVVREIEQMVKERVVVKTPSTTPN